MVSTRSAALAWVLLSTLLGCTADGPGRVAAVRGPDARQSGPGAAPEARIDAAVTSGALEREPCVAGNCAPPCENGTLDFGEVDVDCGGSCDKCPVGFDCATNADCVDNLCFGGRCRDRSVLCQNGLADGAETDVDCGGTLCGPCGPGQRCAKKGDCGGLVCVDGYCDACGDGQKDGGETAIDCGGVCGGCVAGQACQSHWDCLSFVCDQGVCVPWDSCVDGQLSGDESDTDCGGGCDTQCPDGGACASAGGACPWAGMDRAITAIPSRNPSNILRTLKP